MAERLPREPLPLVTITAGTVLARQGEPAPRPLVVVSGALAESCTSPGGRELMLAILGPGDLVAGTEQPAQATLRALRLTRLREARTIELAALVSARERRAIEFAHDLAWLDVTDRLERRLEDLALRFGRQGSDGQLIDLFLRQEDLAALVGATRESVNRAVRSIRCHGRLRGAGRGRYVLLPQLSSVGP